MEEHYNKQWVKLSIPWAKSVGRGKPLPVSQIEPYARDNAPFFDVETPYPSSHYQTGSELPPFHQEVDYSQPEYYITPSHIRPHNIFNPNNIFNRHSPRVEGAMERAVAERYKRLSRRRGESSASGAPSHTPIPELSGESSYTGLRRSERIRSRNRGIYEFPDETQEGQEAESIFRSTEMQE
jgi:hypothetical protein